MPTPKKNESKKDFIDRCVPFLLDEGKTDDPDQAVAICNSIWTESKKGNGMNKVEKRTFQITYELRGDEAERKKLRGHAAVFNVVGEGGWFREKIARGAFESSIKRDDIRALLNHDGNWVLGRNIAGTLNLRETEYGLEAEIDPPDTQWARDLMVSIDRGDITQMSFAFETVRDTWERKKGEQDLRTLEEVKLYDVSVVTFPFYTQTDVAVRSHERWLEQNKPLTHQPFKAKLRNRKLSISWR